LSRAGKDAGVRWRARCSRASRRACTNFEDPTTVIDLRALAVQVQPSEIVLSVDLTDPRNPTVDPQQHRRWRSRRWSPTRRAAAAS
jgi:hypothetical protein